MTDYIDSNQALSALCERASKRAFIILDTEFVRTRTLTPQLGLIQLNDGDNVYLIDPLPITNFAPLIELLLKPDCLKVLHACSEDLETFNCFFGVIPTPIFDTQFAAQLCGLGTSMGYANLVDALLNVKLDKGESRTDWLARPLSAMQCDYAANDVIYLLPAYEHIASLLTQELIDIVISEAALTASKKAAQMPAEYAYLLVKNNWRLNAQQRYVLKTIARWRLERARKKDMALNFVLRESTMVGVAQALPTSKTALSKVAGLTPQENRIAGSTLVELVTQSLAEFENAPESERVAPIKRLSEYSRYKSTMALLKEQVNQVAAETSIPAEVLSSKKQLHQVLKHYWFEIDEIRVQGLQPDLLTGWRKSLFKDRLHTLLA